MKRKNISSLVNLSVLAVLFLLFSSWEYQVDVDNLDIGKLVSFTTPLVIYYNIPESMAGSTIADKYNMFIEAQDNFIYKDHFKSVQRKYVNVNTKYKVISVNRIHVIGLITRSFKGSPVTYYLLKDPNGNLLPMESSLYESSEKFYH